MEAQEQRSSLKGVIENIGFLLRRWRSKTKSRRVCSLILALLFLSLVGSDLAQPGNNARVMAPLEIGKPIERELKAGESHSYGIFLEAGQYLDAAVNQRGIDVVVRVWAPDDGKLAEIDSPNGSHGDEPVSVEAKTTGTYRIEVVPLASDGEEAAGKYEIRINEIVSADVYAKRLAEQKRKQRLVINWIKDNAIPIKTVEAGNGFDDLQPIKRAFRDVRIVGLGEETHGTREFFQFKHRMVEFLVKEMGFRVFAIEASYSACQNINDYVMGRTDDGAKALRSQGFWTWNTEEVRSMLDWMRAYNGSVPDNKKVKFAGFDIQVNDSAKAKLLAFLKVAAPKRAADAEELFNIDEKELGYGAFEKNDNGRVALAKLRELEGRYNALYVFLDLNDRELIAKSSQAEYEQMREYSRVILQFISAYSQLDNFALRDVYMADNFRRLVEREPPAARFVVWAHNGHISTDDRYGPSFGSSLRKFFGKSYYSLGFSFDRGSFQAMGPKINDPKNYELTEFTVDAAPTDSVDWYLAQTGMQSFVVDLRRVEKSGAVGQWLDLPHPMRSIGSTYGSNARAFGPSVLGKEYDGLFFIENATRARPNLQ